MDRLFHNTPSEERQAKKNEEKLRTCNVAQHNIIFVAQVCYTLPRVCGDVGEKKPAPILFRGGGGGVSRLCDDDDDDDDECSCEAVDDDDDDGVITAQSSLCNVWRSIFSKGICK